MLEGRPGVCAEVDGRGGREEDVGCASFEVATGTPCSQGTIFSKPMEIRIWHLDTEVGMKVLISACVFFSLTYILPYTVLPILPA